MRRKSSWLRLVTRGRKIAGLKRHQVDKWHQYSDRRVHRRFSLFGWSRYVLQRLKVIRLFERFATEDFMNVIEATHKADARGMAPDLMAKHRILPRRSRRRQMNWAVMVNLRVMELA